MKKSLFAVFMIFFNSFAMGMTGDVTKQIPSPGTCATGLAFDGKYIWSIDRKSDSIFKIDPADGSIVKTIKSPGYFPTGLAWDGKFLWISDMDFTNTSTESYSGKIYKLNPRTGKTLKVLMAPGSNPQGLAWDGEFLWVSDNSDDMIYKISADDGTTIASFMSPAGDPRGLAWDGSYLWIADRSKDEFYRMHPVKGIVVMVISSPGPYPWGLAWSKKGLLNSDYQTDKISTIKVFDNDKFRRSKMRTEQIEFTSDVINFGPGILTKIDIFIAEPVNRPNQEILEISYPLKPSKMVIDKWGQSSAQFTITDLEAGDRFTPKINVKARVYDVMFNIFPERSGSLSEIPENIKNKFLADDIKYCITDPVIKESVAEACGDEKNPYWLARNIYDFLREKLYYERIGGWDIAPTVLKRGSGSCSEYTFVYIAMCRAAGLPARYVGSVVVRGEDACFDYVYHRWVEVYLPAYGWIPVDPSGGDQKWPCDQAMFFGHLDNRFLITTEGGGGSEYLGWDYNSHDIWQADGPVQLRIEKIAEWSPVNTSE